MARAKRILPEQIESARKMLQALPAKETGKSKEEAAASLAREIQAALKKGYSLKELSGLVKKEGVGISASVMKSTVGETEHKRQKKSAEKSTDAAPLSGQDDASK